jgi:hypothetical protein
MTINERSILIAFKHTGEAHARTFGIDFEANVLGRRSESRWLPFQRSPGSEGQALESDS